MTGYGAAVVMQRRENRRTRSETSLSTTNRTWADLDTNTDLRGDKPATNRLSYGMACFRFYVSFMFSFCQNSLFTNV
jgi:hypothetical protein